MTYGKQFQREQAKNSFRGVTVTTPRIPDIDENPVAVRAAQRIAKEVVKNHPSHGGPVQVFRSGSLQVAVWENEGMDSDGNVFISPSVTFERRYKDREGQWKGTNRLRANDLPKAVMLLSKAYEYLVLSGDEE